MVDGTVLVTQVDTLSCDDGSFARDSGREDVLLGCDSACFDEMLRDVARLSPSQSVTPAQPVFGELVQDKYRIERRLGIGGMGVVFQATHVATGKAVALKWLLASSPSAQVRFAREAYAAAKIDHPNVVNVFDVGTHRGAHFLVMELLRGESLGARLRRDKTLAPRVMVELMLPLLRGLRAVHAAGILHRDIKPDNLFLCAGPDGSAREPKLLDFGVSKLRTPSQAEVHLTGEGCAIGTLAYMAPEQALDAPHVDERCDIYAMGVVMYEALTGRLPQSILNQEVSLPGASADGAGLSARRAERFEPLDAVPAALRRVVSRALSLHPAQRYPDADALLADLASSVSDEIVATPARDSASPVAERSALRSALGLAAALAVLGLGVGVAWFTWLAPFSAPSGAVVLARARPAKLHPQRAQAAQAALPNAPLSIRQEPEVTPAVGAGVRSEAAVLAPVQREAAALPPRTRVKVKARAGRLPLTAL
jgi:serine/threonine-protein kinase